MRATEPQLHIHTVQIRWIENENSLCVFKLHCGLHAYPTIFISTIYTLLGWIASYTYFDNKRHLNSMKTL